jgi:ketosteroid isomerase-like protein
MQPKEVVKRWVEAFNRHDPEEMAAFYHDDATNHQVTQEPVEGREAIKAMFARDFGSAEMVCIIENIFEDRDVAILEWRDPIGLDADFSTFGMARSPYSAATGTSYRS